MSAFKRILKEITDDSLEHDFSPRLVQHFVKDVLGYSGNEYIFERGRTDITLLDENGFRVVVIETKRPREDMRAQKWQDQAAKYADETTRFAGLTNGYHFLLWEIKNGERELKVDLDFKSIVESNKTTEEKLSSREIEQMLFLEKLKRDEVRSESKYEKFNDYYATIDVSDSDGFDKLVETLKYISNSLMRQYTYSAFDEYYAGYQEYQAKLKQIEELEKRESKNKKEASNIAELKLKVQSQYKKYASFSGFYEWRTFSNRNDRPNEENKQVFCKESIYVVLNRLLFIRICEDKGLLKKKISNGGIEAFKEFVDNPDEAYKQVLGIAYQNASSIYKHFYEKGNPLDWYETGDGELNKALNRTLWLLNQFDFSKVDKDILGKMYEHYLPKEERKRLGEFYTPDEVIDYILDSIGYNASGDIERREIIDPACGSGGFLVRATRRLIGRHAVKFGKAAPREATDIKKWPAILERLSPKECEQIVEAISSHIHGFDINPFAVHISEMNLLFQTIDLYQKAKEGNPRFQLKRFLVYRTDSLELPNDQTELLQYSSPTGQALAQDKNEINAIKRKKFDFVVGNPPYVKTAEWHEKTLAEYYRKHYKSTFRNFDLYMIFIELGIKLLKDTGVMAYICSNQFMTRDYGVNLRQYLIDNAGIQEIVDFKDNQVFDSATNYAAILVFSKRKQDNATIVLIDKTSPDVLDRVEKTKSGATDLSDNLFRMFTLPASSFTKNSWILRDGSAKDATDKLSKMDTLKKYADFVSGLRIGSDGLYVVNIVKQGEYLSQVNLAGKKNPETFNIENGILRDILRRSNVRRYRWITNTKSVIYPHGEPYANNTIPEKELEERFPNALRHFKKFQTELNKRVWFDKSAKELHGEFYAMMYFDLPEDFEKARIVTPALTNEPNFTLNHSGATFVGGTAGVIGIIPKIDYKVMLGILNSSVFKYYMKDNCPPKRGGYYQLSVGALERFPFPEIDDADKEVVDSIRKNVEKIIALGKEIAESQNVVLNFGKGEIETQELSKSAFIVKSELSGKVSKPSLEDDVVIVNNKSRIECKNRIVAKYVYYYLQQHLQNRKAADIMKEVRIPLDVQSIEKHTKAYENSIGKINKNQSELNDVESEVNNLVLRVYGLKRNQL